VSQLSLLRKRRFLPLFVTQFMGALNDNVLKNAMIVLVAFDAGNWSTIDAAVLANLAGGIFILPFFLFSASAGQLADKFDKARLARIAKILEVAIVLVAGLGLYMQNLEMLFVSLFLLGLQSAFFGPVKYAILPQHLPRNELVGGNALIESGTFIAILSGTIMGGLLAATDSATLAIICVGLFIAFTGYLASRHIPSAPPPEPLLCISFNPPVETWRTIRLARSQPLVFLSIIAISWFWLYGAVFLAQFPAYTKNLLHGDELMVTILLAIFTVGIGGGSLLCERLSRGQLELGLTSLGTIGLAVFGFDFAWVSAHLPATNVTTFPTSVLLTSPTVWRALFDLFMIGIFGGLFIVPLYAYVQSEAKRECVARIIAANNIMNALFITIGALSAALLLTAGISLPWLFAITAFFHVAITLYLNWRAPIFKLRFASWLRVSLRGRNASG